MKDTGRRRRPLTGALSQAAAEHSRASGMSLPTLGKGSELAGKPEEWAPRLGLQGGQVRRSRNSSTLVGAFATVAVALALAPASYARAACTSDEQCKWGRICRDGSCADDASAASTASGGCQRDKDCPDKDVCDAGTCHAPRSTAPASPTSASRSVSSHGSLTRCNSRSDCPNHAWCEDGACNESGRFGGYLDAGGGLLISRGGASGALELRALAGYRMPNLLIGVGVSGAYFDSNSALVGASLEAARVNERFYAGLGAGVIGSAHGEYSPQLDVGFNAGFLVADHLRLGLVGEFLYPSDSFIASLVIGVMF